MRKITIILLLTFSCTKGLAFDISMSKECSGVDELEFIDCVKNSFIMSTITLKKAEAYIKEKIQKWNSDEDEAIRKEAVISLKRLESSNREFIRYRFAQCSFTLTWGARVGRLAFSRLYPCYTELNKIRAMQLNNAYISDFQNPDEISSK
ncbi:TPA: hypothetical protein ACH9TE_004565 [Escherichia coli]|nr:DUF1311 domain-containing protein [Escherichia coli]MCJ3027777.1 hypothetical protein [Escherichia coli]HAH2177794.1 hypothetical protein [Escherichia coli]HAW5898645.1 hypothetical protein [Escherichia coli]HBA6998721.1 hypothetical protein [Escherichia coli]